MTGDLALNQVDLNALIDVIAVVESDGINSAIGDNGRSFGILQIQQGCLEDFNRWNGTRHTLTELVGHGGEILSRQVFKDYVKHYATKELIGREPTVLDAVRIWNGGPSGWKKLAATAPYIKRFTEISTKKNFHVYA